MTSSADQSGIGRSRRSSPVRESWRFPKLATYRSGKRQMRFWRSSRSGTTSRRVARRARAAGLAENRRCRRVDRRHAPDVRIEQWHDRPDLAREPLADLVEVARLHLDAVANEIR